MGSSVSVSWRKRKSITLGLAEGGNQATDPIVNDGIMHGSIEIATGTLQSSAFTWQVRNEGGNWAACPAADTQSDAGVLPDETTGTASQKHKVIPVECLAFDEIRLLFGTAETNGVAVLVQLFGGEG